MQKKGKSSSGGGGGTSDLEISLIHFTHSKIRGTFTGCGKTLEATLKEIKEGVTKIDDIPRIKVIFDGSRYYSMNNRRLWVFKQLEAEGLLKTVPVFLEAEKPTSK